VHTVCKVINAATSIKRIKVKLCNSLAKIADLAIFLHTDLIKNLPVSEAASPESENQSMFQGFA